MTKEGKVKYVTSPNNRRLTPKLAQAYGEAMSKLEATKAGLTRKRLLEVAASPNSIFHKEFEWDDDKAAFRHRLDQAARLIRWVQVELVVESSQGKGSEVTTKVELPRAHRAFLSVTNGKGQRHYVHFNAVKQQAAYRQQLLDACVQELRRWTEKARVYRELDRVRCAALAMIPDVHKATKKTAPAKKPKRTPRRKRQIA